MKHSIFSDEEVAGVARRHESRKAEKLWTNTERESAIKDMDDLLAELARTNIMVEVLEEDKAAYRKVHEDTLKMVLEALEDASKIGAKR